MSRKTTLPAVAEAKIVVSLLNTVARKATERGIAISSLVTREESALGRTFVREVQISQAGLRIDRTTVRSAKLLAERMAARLSTETARLANSAQAKALALAEATKAAQAEAFDEQYLAARAAKAKALSESLKALLKEKAAAALANAKAVCDKALALFKEGITWQNIAKSLSPVERASSEALKAKLGLI